MSCSEAEEMQPASSLDDATSKIGTILPGREQPCSWPLVVGARPKFRIVESRTGIGIWLQ